ncbi:MAG: PilN domain-containing protein [Candidatus Omnitrophica bacterium]|nr:PilN domain-containing protein [Candidatus Omnitrophota bacterium]MDD5352734.1 PilN domain-containing protein [Candidatus Omnitrophota bacterium]MDD5550333.1 PilN domain-containing protein [Candidatus Omnitrophota bacterium]
MIRINLLPANLRRRETSIDVPQINMLPVVSVAVLVVLAIHIIFFLLSYDKKMRLGSLAGTWDKKQQQFKEIEDLKKNLILKKDKVKTIESFLRRDFYLTDFLNKVNQAVPKGLWLTRLSFSIDGLVIEGSVFSSSSELVSLVNNFFNGLKSDVFFQQNFDNFNLDSVQRKNIKEYEVLDFLLTAGIRQQEEKIVNSSSNRKK